MLHGVGEAHHGDVIEDEVADGVAVKTQQTVHAAADQHKQDDDSVHDGVHIAQRTHSAMDAGAGKVDGHDQVYDDDEHFEIHAAAQKVAHTRIQLNDGQTHVRTHDDQRHDHEGIHDRTHRAVTGAADEGIQSGAGAEGAAAIVGGDGDSEACHGHDEVSGDAIVQEAVLNGGDHRLGSAALHAQEGRRVQEVLHRAGHAEEADADGDTAGEGDGHPGEGLYAGLGVLTAQADIAHLAEHDPQAKDAGDHGAEHIDPLEVLHCPGVEGVHAVVERGGERDANANEQKQNTDTNYKNLMVYHRPNPARLFCLVFHISFLFLLFFANTAGKAYTLLSIRSVLSAGATMGTSATSSRL